MIPAAALAVLLAGAVPEQPQYFATVNFVVINHCRSFNTEWDQWDRPRFKPSSTTWVSFYSWLTVPMPWGFGLMRLPCGWISRGWWTAAQMRNIVRCGEGWLLESTDNLNVIARDVFVISSDYDWELRHRRLYCPMRRP